MISYSRSVNISKTSRGSNIIDPAKATPIRIISLNGIKRHIFGMCFHMSTLIRGMANSVDRKIYGRPILTYRCATGCYGCMKDKRNIGGRCLQPARDFGLNNRRWMSWPASLRTIKKPLGGAGARFKTLRMMKSLIRDGRSHGIRGKVSKNTITTGNLFGLKRTR
jgi:hypothetical protein